jgi:hypothetical protein
MLSQKASSVKTAKQGATIATMKGNKKSLLIACFIGVVASVLLFPAKILCATEVIVEAEGTANIVDNNQVAAREKALQDFEKQAITKAVIDLIGEDQFNQNKEKLQKTIIGRADRYLKAYKVIGEEPREGTYRVKGEAIIRLDALKKDLASLKISLLTSKPSKDATPPEEQPSREAQKAQSDASEELKQTQRQTPTKSLPVILWNFDRSCDEQIEGKNAGDFFSDVFIEKLSEAGFTVVTADHNLPQEESKVVTLKGNFFCFTNKISIRMELSQGDNKQQLEDDVPLDEETPIMDAVMTLADISADHVFNAITQPGEVSKNQQEPHSVGAGLSASPSEEPTSQEASKSSPSAQEDTRMEKPPESGQPHRVAPTFSGQPQGLPLPLWQIVIKDPNGALYWEKILRKLKESGVNIEVSRILISPDTFTVETPEISEKVPGLIETILEKEGITLKVESVDSQARRIIIRSQTGR